MLKTAAPHLYLKRSGYLQWPEAHRAAVMAASMAKATMRLAARRGQEPPLAALMPLVATSCPALKPCGVVVAVALAAVPPPDAARPEIPAMYVNCVMPKIATIGNVPLKAAQGLQRKTSYSQCSGSTDPGSARSAVARAENCAILFQIVSSVHAFTVGMEGVH